MESGTVNTFKRSQTSTARKVFLAALAGALVFWHPDARAAGPGIIFDNSNSGTGVGSATFSHTVTTSGVNQYLIVTVALGDDNSSTAAVPTATVTYGGVAMVSLAMAVNSNDCRTYVFGLDAPATGANNVVVTASSMKTTIVATATSLENVDSAVGTGTLSG